MEKIDTTEILPETTEATERVHWGLKLRFHPERQAYEVLITLPKGEEDNLPNLLEPAVLQGMPEILRALESGRLPGNEIDLARKN